jgi:hypothetical protein
MFAADGNVSGGSGTSDDSWQRTPPSTSEYTIYRDEKEGTRL